MPISSGKAVPSLSVRVPSRLISTWDFGTSGRRTMADVVKMSLGLSKVSVTKAPVKDEKSDVPYPFSNSLTESAATRDQLQESASVSNQNLRDEDVTNPFSNSFMESAARSDQFRKSASISSQNLRDDDVTNPFSNSYAATRDQLQDSALVFNQNLRDNDLSYFSKSFIESATRQNQRPESALVSNQNLRSDDVSYPFIESAAGRNQFLESASVLNQNLHNYDYGGSRLLCDEDNNKNDEIYQVERRSFELNRSEIFSLLSNILFF